MKKFTKKRKRFEVFDLKISLFSSTNFLIAVMFIFLFLISGCSKTEYDFNYNLEPDFVLKSAGFSKTEYISNLITEIDSVEHDSWGLADSYLIFARLENSSEYYKKACKEFIGYRSKDKEELAVLYETLASLNCFSKREFYLKKAGGLWKDLGVGWRYDLLEAVIKNNVDDLIKFETSEIKPNLDLSSADKIVIGKTSIEIKRGDKVITQIDRVFRDWLGVQINQNPFSGSFLKVFSERLSYNESELREDIGWHEGSRMNDLKETLRIVPVSSAGVLVAKKDERWYASDDNGIFRFEVPFDKVSYPTTRFLTESLAMIVDTHGVNMLVESALRKGVDAVLSDCDHPDKVKAAVYLSERGVKVICFPDLFVYKAFGHNADLVGSPVWKFDSDREVMIYGDSPVVIQRDQKIVVMDADIGNAYAVWYYKAPMFYFAEINRTFPLDIIPAVVDGFRQSEIVYDIAREHNVNLVASRVFDSYDYIIAKDWLEEDEKNKLILFHSTMYPYAILLMQEFSDRISFNDPNPEKVD